MVFSLVGPYVVVFIINLFGGAIATFGVGLALHSLTLNLVAVFIAIIIADTISDTAYYMVGRFASTAVFEKFFKPGSKSASRLASIEYYFQQHGATTIFLGKMSDILAVPAVVLAGITKMRFSLYVLICIPTSILKTAVILLAGYLLSRSANPHDGHFVVYGIGGLFLVALIMFTSVNFYKTMTRQSTVAKRTVTKKR